MRLPLRRTVRQCPLRRAHEGRPSGSIITGLALRMWRSARAVPGGMTACVASPSSLSLSPSQSTPVAVSFTAGPYGSTGSVQLTATQTNGSAQDNGSINVTVPNTYALAVTPDAQAVSVPSGAQ